MSATDTDRVVIKLAVVSVYTDVAAVYLAGTIMIVVKMCCQDSRFEHKRPNTQGKDGQDCTIN
jgi:hypothetical protein